MIDTYIDDSIGSFNRFYIECVSTVHGIGSKSRSLTQTIMINSSILIESKCTDRHHHNIRCLCPSICVCMYTCACMHASDLYRFMVSISCMYLIRSLDRQNDEKKTKADLSTSVQSIEAALACYVRYSSVSFPRTNTEAERVLSTALHYYTRAAALGDGNAIFQVGMLHLWHEIQDDPDTTGGLSPDIASSASIYSGRSWARAKAAFQMCLENMSFPWNVPCIVPWMALEIWDVGQQVLHDHDDHGL